MSDSKAQPTKIDSADSDANEVALRARYQELVDQKYLRGLTAAEQVEFEDLGRAIDALDAPFYQSAIEYLQRRLAQKRHTGD